MKSPRRLLLALLPALVAGMGHPTAHAQAPQPVRVGFICPFTGGSADFGLAARMGAELAVKEINEVGGFMGRPLELVARDDQSNPAVGRQAAEELVGGKKADFTIGFCNTGVALNALEVFQNAHHLLLIPVATGTALTAKYPAASSLVFRLSVRDALQAAFLVDVDLSGARLTTIRGVGSLRGAVVSTAQLVEMGPLLANHLGIQVRDSRPGG